MMKKRLALVLVLVMMASTAITAFASPFADVPADHWAYDSVAELAAAGLIEGYPDGTFGGARMMTRYEAAMVFARALHRLEGQNANLLPELDKIKAELMAEIEAQMAAAGKPVVETRVIETVEKELDEATAARVRANEIAIDAIEGDMAYLEARMLGLIDGIRYDMNLLEEQEVVVEQPSMDEIEALIAARVQESLLDVASGVKETTIVERVVATTPELTKADVEFIAEALIRQQVEGVETTVRENRELIVGLVEWVDELDTDVAVLKDDVEGLKTSVAILEKSPVISGELTLKGAHGKPTSSDPKQYHFAQTGTLNLNIKASETTDVKAVLGFGITAGTLAKSVTNYRVEVASETPVSRVVVGRLVPAVFDAHDFSGYVLTTNAPAGYRFGGIARVDIIEDLTLDLAAIAPTDEDNKIEPDGSVRGALALRYAFMPEIGIKLTGALDKPRTKMFENYAAGVGLFGTVAGVEYTGDFAMDFADKNEKNYLAVVTAETTFDPVTIDGKFVYQEENYNITNQLVLKDEPTKFGVEGGVKADLDLFGFGLDLAGRAYYEGGGDASTDTALAFKANASATIEEFFAPITLSAQYIGNKTGGSNADFRHHAMAKVELAEEADYGLRYGASAAYVKNVLSTTPGLDYRYKDYILTDDQVQLGANVGYGVDWSGAKVDLDYKAGFVLTTQPAEKASKLTHNVDVGYAFTDNVKLTLGGVVSQTLAEPLVNDFGYSAGLSVKF